MSLIPAFKKRMLPSILRVCFLSLVGIVIGINFYAWNSRSLLGNTLPMPFGYGAAIVLSGSMEPTLKINDLIIIKEQDTYSPGEIVVFQDGRSFTVHRLMEIDAELAITKGDANNVADAPINIGNIRGSVLISIPGIGSIIKALKSPYGTVCLVVFLLVAIELPYYQEKKRSKKTTRMIQEEIRRLKEEREAEDL